MPRVYNKRDPNVPKDAVYVGRPSRWGNQYKIPRDGNRAEVIAKYRGNMMRSPVLRRWVKAELCGKDLVCWCAPEPCHADVLLEVANED